MALTAASRFSSVNLGYSTNLFGDWTAGSVTVVTDEDEPQTVSITTETIGEDHFVAPPELLVLQGIYASPNGFRDADGDAVVPFVMDYPFGTTLEAVEENGGINPLRAQSVEDVFNRHRVLADLGRVVTRRTVGDSLVHELDESFSQKPFTRVTVKSEDQLSAGEYFALFVPDDKTQAPVWVEVRADPKIEPTVLAAVRADTNNIVAADFTIVGDGGLLTLPAVSNQRIILARPVAEGDINSLVFSDTSGVNSARSFSKLEDTIDLMIGGEAVTCAMWASTLRRTHDAGTTIRVFR